MHVITRKALVEFWTRHPDSREALARWHKIVEKSSYQSFAELRLTFPSADIVGQTEQVMQKLQVILEEAGTSFEHALKANCYLTDISEFSRFNAVYALSLIHI